MGEEKRDPPDEGKDVVPSVDQSGEEDTNFTHERWEREREKGRKPRKVASGRNQVIKQRVRETAGCLNRVYAKERSYARSIRMIRTLNMA